MAKVAENPQMEFDEVSYENEELLDALEQRQAFKAAVAEHRKAASVIKEKVAELPPKLIGKKVRIGRFTFMVIRDEGGIERPGYTTKAGIKARKIQCDED